MEDIHVSRLSNGLTVVIQEAHAAPVAAFWVWYRVGSRNERPGLTGVSHWVEHMLFKGTPAHPPGMLTRLVDRLGGRWNAFTWKDYTAYFELLPAAHIDVAVRLEADRMQNTIFDDQVVASERTVIISEREGAENFPSYSLYEEVEALAFKLHPYRQPVIGWKSDLRLITRDDLYRHYRAYYHPANAIIVAVGDFDAAHMAEVVASAFDPVPARESSSDARVEEPPQEGERRTVLRRPGGATAYFLQAFHTPAAAHPDVPALMVLSGVLAGFRLLPFDGGTGGRSSRLYRALVDGGLATDIDVGFRPSIDPALLHISATVRTGIDVAAVEKAVDQELMRLHHEPVEPVELDRVKRQAKAQIVYLRDGVFRRALALGVSAVVDRPEALSSLAQAVDRITVDDVTQVARTYLVERNRTVGWYVPDPTGSSRESLS
jgi:zinc protease